MSEITETALDAVYQKGYETGRQEAYEELKGGKRWWWFWPMTLFMGLTIGSMMGLCISLVLFKLMAKP